MCLQVPQFTSGARAALHACGGLVGVHNVICSAASILHLEVTAEVLSEFISRGWYTYKCGAFKLMDGAVTNIIKTALEKTTPTCKYLTQVPTCTAMRPCHCLLAVPGRAHRRWHAISWCRAPHLRLVPCAEFAGKGVRAALLPVETALTPGLVWWFAVHVIYGHGGACRYLFACMVNANGNFQLELKGFVDRVNKENETEKKWDSKVVKITYVHGMWHSSQDRAHFLVIVWGVSRIGFVRFITPTHHAGHLQAQLHTAVRCLSFIVRCAPLGRYGVAPMKGVERSIGKSTTKYFENNPFHTRTPPQFQANATGTSAVSVKALTPVIAKVTPGSDPHERKKTKSAHVQSLHEARPTSTAAPSSRFLTDILRCTIKVVATMRW